MSAARGLVASLWGFAFLSYLLRTNIAVAQQYMARDLGYSIVQIGQMYTAFLLSYTLFQVPAGLLGDRFGPRIVLTISALGWTLTTFLTGALPGLLVKGATASLAAVLMVRFVHGIEEAATYPVAMIAVADWFTASSHAFISSLIFAGSTMGAAFSPPLVANLMNHFGWRATFYFTAIAPMILVAIWWRQTRGRSHTTSDGQRSRTLRDWIRLFTQRDLAMLCLSYLLYCYAISIFVYWLFKYLVDVRHFSIVGSGWATSLPWIAASIAVPIVGYLSRQLSQQSGRLYGRRLTATLCLLAAAVLMFVGASAGQIGLALTAISLSVALLFSTESSYWSTAIDLEPSDAGAASGLMNLAGNLGGVLSTVLVPVLVSSVGWYYALLSGSLLAAAAAGCWFLLSSKSEDAEAVSYTEGLPRDFA